MGLDLTVYLGDSNPVIKLIDQLHSNSSARVIINENFKRINQSILGLINFSISDLNGLILPTQPTVGVFYNLVYNGSSWTVVESPSNFGTKFRLRDLDNIIVKEDYQYLVHDNLILDGGSITVEGGGEIVIL